MKRLGSGLLRTRSSTAVRSVICGSVLGSGGRLFWAIRRLPVAIKAFYTEIHPITKRPLFLLSRDDYEKVRQGYGCPHCLEDYNGVYLVKCPVCNHMTDFGGGDFIPVTPQHMIPEDPSLLHDVEGPDHFSG